MNSADHDKSIEDGDRVFLYSVGFELSLGVLALFLGYLTEIQVRDHIPSWTHGTEILRSIGYGIAYAVPLFALMAVVQYLPLPSLQKLSSAVESRLLQLFRPLPWQQWGMICLAAGVGEELLFRGWLQSLAQEWLSDRLGLTTGVVVAIAIASVVFGFCHFLSWSYFLLATLCGIFLGWIYYSTQNLLIPIVTHGVYDAAMLAWILWSSRNPTSR